MSVFVSAVFVVLETCVYCDLCFLCLHVVFSVFVFARVFVVLNLSLVFCNRCLFAVFVVAFVRFFNSKKLCL